MRGELIFEFLNAAHGDAILVHWGSPQRLALFDGGPSHSFGLALGPRLEALRVERTGARDLPLVLDLVCVTHVDDDHVGGILRLLTDLRREKRDNLPPSYRIVRLWHNSFEDLVSAAPAGPSSLELERASQDMTTYDTISAASINQGREVRDLGRALEIGGNDPFGSPVVGGLSTSLFELAITIVTPDRDALDSLEKKWRKARYEEDPSVLGAAFTDRSVPNLSSISSLIAVGSSRGLLTADARGDRVIEGLEASGVLPPGGTIHLDLLQVPHHGSSNNTDQEFFERITADHYMISADGVAHPHPDAAVLQWLVNARGDDGYEIHLTNQVEPALAQLDQLGTGRNFEVEARADPMLAVSVTLASRD